MLCYCPCKILVNIVVQALAHIGRELHSAGYHVVPLFLRQPVGHLLTGDIIFHKTIDKASIKVITSTNGTHHIVVLQNRILLLETVVGTQHLSY